MEVIKQVLRRTTSLIYFGVYNDESRIEPNHVVKIVNYAAHLLNREGGVYERVFDNVSASTASSNSVRLSDAQV